MNLYNLIEYSDNYADTTASLYHSKGAEQFKNNNLINNLTINNLSSFKYQSNLIKKQELNSKYVAANIDPDVVYAHRLRKNAKIVVPLKHISNSLGSLELH